jgi:rhodanese-related sulfurtransferase
MAQSYQDLLAAAREEVPEIQVAELADRLFGDDAPIIIDVREQSEWDEGHVPGAVHVPRGYLESRIAGVARPDDSVVLICAGGFRSLLAGRNLREMGYDNVESVAGGFTRWKQAGNAYDVPQTLTPDQRSRYIRHTLIPEVGEAGQLKLLGAKVLLIGAGGLGSPSAYYLAAAGGARSGSSTTTSSTRAICSARSSTRPTAWAR